MTLHISEYKLPENPVVGADIRIPVTVKNDTSHEVEVRVYLYSEKEGGGSVLWDYEPDIHWQNIPAGGEYSFSGFWDTLTCTLADKEPWHFWIILREQSTLGVVDRKDFTLQAVDRPYWWGALVDNIMTGNVEAITNPVLSLFAFDEIPGFTAPPFSCWICGAEFDGETAHEDFADHLLSHFKAFVSSFFST